MELMACRSCVKITYNVHVCETYHIIHKLNHLMVICDSHPIHTLYMPPHYLHVWVPLTCNTLLPEVTNSTAKSKCTHTYM